MCAGWFLLAVYVGEMDLLAQLPVIAPPLIIAGLTTLVAGSYFLVPGFRRAIDLRGDRALVAVHLMRFVGIYFLMLSAKGELDPRFAVPAGWGDLAAALGAVALLSVPAPRWAYGLWNTFGLADILFVVAKAASLRLEQPDSLDALMRLPLSVLPTMVVPLIIATHIILFARLLRRSHGNDDPLPSEALPVQ